MLNTIQSIQSILSISTKKGGERLIKGTVDGKCNNKAGVEIIYIEIISPKRIEIIAKMTICFCWLYWGLTPL